MPTPDSTPLAGNGIRVFFPHDQPMHSRSVSNVLVHDRLDIPTPPTRITADWDREIASLDFEAGDIDTLPLARTVMRWPDYAQCLDAVTAWLNMQGLPNLPGNSDIALMACIGTPYHHDSAQYGSSVFCNLFLSDDKGMGMDMHFPLLNQRIPLTRGTVVIFDTGQPHAVIPRSSSGFDVADFTSTAACTQVFLTWELPINNPHLQRLLHIDVDVASARADASASAKATQAAQLYLHGSVVTVCPASGQLLPGL